MAFCRSPELSGSATHSLMPARIASSICVGSSVDVITISGVVGCCLHGARIVPVGKVGYIEHADRHKTRASGTGAGGHAATANSLGRGVPVRTRIAIDQGVDALLRRTHPISRELIEMCAERRERSGAG